MEYEPDDETTHLATRDLMTLLFGSMLMIVVVSVSFVADAKKTPTDTDAERDRNTLTVNITWPTGSHFDVDLWLAAPGEPPVGFMNRNGRSCNLVRDDLGEDNSPINDRFETTKCRGIVDGEYVANINLYSNRRDERLPVAVPWDITVQNDGAERVIASGTAALEAVGQELTLARFTVRDQHFLAGSVNAVFRAMANAND